MRTFGETDIDYSSQTAVLSCRRKSVDYTEMVFWIDRNRKSPIIWAVIEKTRSAEKRILFTWLRGRFLSNTQTSSSRFCSGERARLTKKAPICRWFEGITGPNNTMCFTRKSAWQTNQRMACSRRDGEQRTMWNNQKARVYGRFRHDSGIWGYRSLNLVAVFFDLNFVQKREAEWSKRNKAIDFRFSNQYPKSCN